MNPLFEYPNYPFYLPEGQSLYDKLCELYSNAQAIEELYSKCGALVTEIPALTTGIAPANQMREALGNLSRKGLIKKLCDVLAASNPSGALRKILAKATECKSGIDKRVVNINQLVLDREDYRDRLEWLANEDHSIKVLLIKGGPKSGKTYSRHLFEIKAKELNATSIYTGKYNVDIEQFIGHLFSIIAPGEPIPDISTTDPAWYAKICRKLLAFAKIQKQQFWIAIDDLGYDENKVPLMDYRIREFLEQFVVLMVDASFRLHFKLLVLNYPPGNLPSSWYRDHIYEENFDEKDVKKKDIEESILNWCAGKQRLVNPQEISDLASKVIADDEALAHLDDVPPRLDRLRTAVTTILKNFNSQAI